MFYVSRVFGKGLVDGGVLFTGLDFLTFLTHLYI